MAEDWNTNNDFGDFGNFNDDFGGDMGFNAGIGGMNANTQLPSQQASFPQSDELQFFSDSTYSQPTAPAQTQDFQQPPNSMPHMPVSSFPNTFTPTSTFTPAPPSSTFSDPSSNTGPVDFENEPPLLEGSLSVLLGNFQNLSSSVYFVWRLCMIQSVVSEGVMNGVSGARVRGVQ